MTALPYRLLPATLPTDAAFDVDALFRVYGPRMRARVRRYFSDEEADDVLQEVYLRAITKLHTFRGESSPGTWLYQLTTRHCLTRIRDASRRRAFLVKHPDVWWSRPTTRPDQETKALYDEVVRDWDAETATAVTCHEVDGMTRAEIAVMLGCSVRTVTNRLSAARVLTQARASA